MIGLLDGRVYYRLDAWLALHGQIGGFPLVRGWFRQDDHPVAALLYRRFTTAEYVAWLRRLGVAYVVLTDAPPDHTSKQEARLVRSGRAGLREVFAGRNVSIYAVPQPTSIRRPTARRTRCTAAAADRVKA